MTRTAKKNEDLTGIKKQRPLFLELLCVYSFVFFGIIALLFLISVFYSGWVADVISQYTQNSYSKQEILVIMSGGFIFHACAFTGIVIIWNLKKSGYWLFSISSLITAVYHLFHHNIPVYYTALYIVLIILFGLFYRRLK